MNAVGGGIFGRQNMLLERITLEGIYFFGIIK